jgi:AcrR family transcriptional regulator
MNPPSTTTRAYRQKARAESTEATRQRIVDTATRLFVEYWYDEVSLREIASQAGVAQQTVLNHFGTKDAVFLAGIAQFGEQRLAARAGGAPDDVAAAAATIVADYEDVGEANLRSLALEERVPALQDAMAQGREGHRGWVIDTFPGALAGLRGARRERRIGQLAVATDVYTWRLLRNDHGLDVDQTVEAITEMLTSLYPKTKTKEGA